MALVVRLELIQNLRNFTASTNSLSANQVRKCLFKNDEAATKERLFVDSEQREEITKAQTLLLMQSIPSLVRLAQEAGVEPNRLERLLRASLFIPRCYNKQLTKQLSDAILSSAELPALVSKKADEPQLANVSVKAKPSTPTVGNRVSAPTEANSKKEYEDLVVTAQTSQRPSKAGTPVLQASLLKKRNYD